MGHGSIETTFPPIEFWRQHHSSKNEHDAHFPILRAPLCSGEEMRTPIRRSVLQEEKEAKQMLARKYVLVPIPPPPVSNE